MPVRVIPCQDALRNLEMPYARWPRRGSDQNRLEPLARPYSEPRFQIKRGSTVFTIGSCFARHIEVELEQLGFVIPTRGLNFDDLEGQIIDTNLLNNYAVPAIYNEISWALGEQHFVPSDHILEISPGLFADVHLPARSSPLASFETVLARRQRIFEMTRSVLTADAIVMTLGLAEAWYDHRSGSFLNTRPHRSVLASSPDRFTLHVLSYQDVIESLERTFSVLKMRCRTDVKIVLTVSPVPMTATFTGTDVLVANQYSKSVLRAAAEEICSRHENVEYFPSYETVILSDRSEAWQDDLVHVRNVMVRHVVNAVCREYVGSLPSPDAAFTRAEPSTEAYVSLAAAQTMLRENNFSDAIAQVEKHVTGPLRTRALNIQGRAYIGLKQHETAEKVLRYSISAKADNGMAHGFLGVSLSAQGRNEEALAAFRSAVRYSPDFPRWSYLLAKALCEIGKNPEAQKIVESALWNAPGSRLLLRLKDQIVSDNTTLTEATAEQQ